MEASAIRVLLIDDEPDLLDLARHFLELDRDISVDTAISADSAARMIESREYDVIVSDYQMPGKDGIQFLMEMRAKDNSIPFILFTGKGREEVAIEALNSGADFYLQKGGQSAPQFAELSNMIKQAYAREQGERTLRISEGRLRTYMDNAPEGIFIVDPLGDYQDVNKTACSMLKYSREELLNLNIRDITKTSVAQEALDGFQQLKKRGAISMETILVRKDGASVPVFLNAVELPNQRYMAFCADITERKHGEGELRSSEARFHELAEMLPVAVYETDKQGKLTFVNKQAFDMFGYTLQDLVRGSTALDMLMPSEREQGYQNVRKIMQGETQKPKEYAARRKDGSAFSVSIISSPILHQDEIVGMRGVVTDMTDRKLAEDALRKSERKYRLLAENVTDVIWTLNIATQKFTYVSPSVENFSGFTVEETMQQDLKDVLHPDSYDEIVGQLPTWIEQFLQGNMAGKARRLDARQRRKDGKWMDIEVVTTLLREDKGGHTEILGVSRDITERKKIEKTLQESEKRYRLLVESAAEAIVVAQDGMLHMINPMATTIIGFSKEEILSKPYMSFIYPDDRTMVAERFQKRLKGEALPIRYDFRVITKEGQAKWVEINGITIDWKGSPATLNFMTDITERKKAEEELKASKKTLEDIIDFLPDATLVVDQGGTIIAWNQAIEKMTGVSKEDMIGRGGRAYSIPFYGTNRGMLLDLLALDDDDLRKEYDYVTREGSALYAETFCQALYGGKGAHLWGAATFIFDGQGNRVGAIESVRDISSLKQAEAALMEVNKKLNLLTSVTRHDINNQLMILTGQLALMEMSKPDHESNEQLRKAEAAAKQISAIIRFTKEYQGVVVYEPIWQDIRGYVESGSRGIPLGSIRLVNDVPSDTEVFADPLIAKVFPILIDNAVRHGGKITTIRFHVEERSGARVVICEDDGVGISAEMKKGLFTQSSEKGHGFGLFLSHQILAINGISLHENGEPGKGARFEIVIPAGAWRSR